MTILEEDLLTLNPKDILEFKVLNPDVTTSTYAGNIFTIDNIEYTYRGYKAWTDLASILKCRMLTPILDTPNEVIIRYQKLNKDVSFHTNADTAESKYGTNSIFSQIHKMQEPAFLHYYKQALQNVNINKRVRILNLGLNNGDEFEFIREYASNFSNLACWYRLLCFCNCKRSRKIQRIKQYKALYA